MSEQTTKVLLSYLGPDWKKAASNGPWTYYPEKRTAGFKGILISGISDPDVMEHFVCAIQQVPTRVFRARDIASELRKALSEEIPRAILFPALKELYSYEKK